ncbi:hypothetical protein C2845_PM04G19070 [Panicum miliaceum]|uniref:Fatty acyl-CoA reductase n=1 Tax=Panicum miliaceum TaxID=4540 RepID=A0A3L6QWW7_PANMI|nr:hypothetical protein C2845_PM04G19070 [Panicum miliaceum]
MEPAGVAERLHNKTFLITGTTGFIAKRSGEILMLLIMQLQIFRSLREKYQKHFSSWFWDKLYPVAGDVALKNLGIGDVALAKDILKETDIIIHMAATVNFRERLVYDAHVVAPNHKYRYDKALAINTMGVKHIIEIASQCANLELLLLGSTAYVNGKESGIMLEKPLHQYRSYDGQSDLDISEELGIGRGEAQGVSLQECFRRYYKMHHEDDWARKFGWMGTYVFTKAMGEMLAYEQTLRLPIAIIRPTSTTSTWKEPFPGWIEGIKTIDTWITNYGKGHLKVLPGDVTTVIDIVPADTVVNATFCIISYHTRAQSGLIYHIGSSMRNPLEIVELLHTMFRYFTEKRFIGAEGEVIKVNQLIVPATMDSFYEHMDRHYKVPLQDMERCGLSTADDHDRYNHLKREHHFTVAIAELFRPGTFFKRRFDDSNMQSLYDDERQRQRTDPCDTKFINWEKYLMEIHIPSVMDYESREATRARL